MLIASYRNSLTVTVALLVALFGVVAAVIIGWLASEYDSLPVAVLPGLALFGILFATRPVWLLWSAIIGGLIITGVSKLYVPQLQLVRWALIPIAVALLLHTLWSALSSPDGRRVLRGVPSMVWWLLAFLGLTMAATLFDDFQLNRLAAGLKGYFQVWGLFFALAFYPWPKRVIEQLPKAMLWIAVLQIPFVLQQLLVLVPMRQGMGDGIVPIDIVSGTFGATLEGGGANAILNAFLVIVFAGVVATYQAGALSLWRMLTISALLVFPVLVNQAKVSVIYVIVSFAMLFRKSAMRSPLRFLGAMAAGALLLFAIGTAYTLNAPEGSGVESIGDLIRFTYEYNVENETVADRYTRFAALEFWVDSHGVDNLVGTMFGHGAGYTRFGNTDIGFRETTMAFINGIPVEIDLGMKIGNTAVSALLWEVGVIGLLCVLGLLISTFIIAGRLSKIHSGNAVRSSALRAAQIAMLIVFVTLWHKSVFVFDVAYQTLLMLIIGYVAYWERVRLQKQGADDEDARFD